MNEPLSFVEWGREEFRLAVRRCVISSVGYGDILELGAQYSEYTKKKPLKCIL